MIDNTVWFDDCVKAIEALRKARPSLSTFSKIEGNMYGDFVIYAGGNIFIVTHDDFSVYLFDKETKHYDKVVITYYPKWED